MTEYLTEQAAQLAELCLKRSGTLVSAESCTGGALAEILTRLPRSSAWFERGFITYSNQSKCELLSVSPHTLEQCGSVSETTASEMVQGAIAHSHADYGVAITGVAGPDGGTPSHPVGTVCFAWQERGADGHTVCAFFDGDRHKIRTQACMRAIQGLLDLLHRT